VILPIALFFQVAAAQGPLPEIVTRPRLDPRGGVDFHALVTPESVYVGQQATYELGVFIDQETRTRLRRNPEFIPPESRAMLAYDLPDPGGTISVTRDGRSYEVHVFRRALFPLTPGRYQIPTARLAYTLPQSQSFFSREESFSLRSEEVTLVAIDPPMAGRPPDWSGAVGVWRVSARVDTTRDRAGDPFVLTLRVEGQGNVTLLPRPPLTIPWAMVVPANERVTLDSTPTILRGSKEFDWLVTPRTGGAQRIPPIRFAFFNPFSRRFEVSESAPFTVQVAPGDVVAVDSAAPPPPVAEAPLVLRASLGDETPAPLGDLPVVRWFVLLLPLPAVIVWLVRRPRRVREPVTAAERLRAMAKAGAGGAARGATGAATGAASGAALRDASPADVRHVLLDAIRQRTGLDAASLTQPGAWAHSLMLEGVTEELAAAFEAFLDTLDAAAFGGASGGGAALAARALEFVARIDREARRGAARESHARVLFPVGVFIIALMGMTATAIARDIERAREPFARAAVAYAGADYVRAARLFEDAAREAPRAAAAWANAGTAAWAAGDTASAVVGWQRALRLDPIAIDLRDRLARVQAPQDVGAARVPSIPARVPSALALLLWTAGWLAVAWRAWKRRPVARLCLATVVLAGGVGIYARRFENALDGRALMVVADPGALRALPALGAEGEAVPMVGEVARVVQRKGVWTEIALDGGRNGWIASERLAALGKD
jgi:tetratricopeptide (TPR) repeat protein